MIILDIAIIIIGIILILIFSKRIKDINNKIKEARQEELELRDKNNSLKTQNELLKQNIQNYEEISGNYQKVLEQYYLQVEKEYDNNLQQLKDDTDKQIQIIQNNIEKERIELLKIQNTRKAAIEAQIREQKIKEQLSFYCLKLNTIELQDIAKLNDLKPSLNNPRILSMLIWQNYYQKPMTELCNNVIGKNIVCGIYKITNQLNNMCYIGQSVDVAKRLKDHAKCGLGIDTPQNNKLYKAMIQDGLHNFSFELLESCKKEELDEKEKSYIKIYQSQSFGYNTVSGNGAIDLLGE